MTPQAPVETEATESSAQPEFVEREERTETTTSEWRTEVGSQEVPVAGLGPQISSLLGRLLREAEAVTEHFSSGRFSGSEGTYEASSRTEFGPGGEVRVTRSESGRGPEGQPYQARSESLSGPDGQLSESSHESGRRPEFAPEFGSEFGGAPVFDRARQRPADTTRQGVGAPVGAPVTTSRHAREAKAGRPLVSRSSSANPQNPFGAFLPGLNSDSQTEKAASIAMVLAIAGWVFCFPISLIALYQVKECKKHALAEGRAVPQLATIATVTAVSNLALMALTCLGNVSLN